MSSIVISGDSSGQVSLTVPSAAGTNTATLPAATGTVMVSGNMPAFKVYGGGTQVVSNGTNTKIQLTTKVFDTASAFDNVTNYRFQPTVAGYYQISGNVGFAQTSNNVAFYCNIFKNGNGYATATSVSTTSTYMICSANALIYLNGSTDYVELYAQQQTGGNSTVTGGVFTAGDATFMTGCLVRAA